MERRERGMVTWEYGIGLDVRDIAQGKWGPC